MWGKTLKTRSIPTYAFANRSQNHRENHIISIVQSTKHLVLRVQPILDGGDYKIWKLTMNACEEPTRRRIWICASTLICVLQVYYLNNHTIADALNVPLDVVWLLSLACCSECAQTTGRRRRWAGMQGMIDKDVRHMIVENLVRCWQTLHWCDELLNDYPSSDIIRWV